MGSTLEALGRVHPASPSAWGSWVPGLMAMSPASACLPVAIPVSLCLPVSHRSPHQGPRRSGVTASLLDCICKGLLHQKGRFTGPGAGCGHVFGVRDSTHCPALQNPAEGQASRSRSLVGAQLRCSLVCARGPGANPLSVSSSSGEGVSPGTSHGLRRVARGRASKSVLLVDTKVGSFRNQQLKQDGNPHPPGVENNHQDRERLSGALAGKGALFPRCG